MKKLFVLTIVLALVALTVVPALAAGSPPEAKGCVNGFCLQKAPFALVGTIANLDPDTRTVTVTVVCGNLLVKPFIGENLTLQTTDATRFLQRVPGSTAIPITFEDLAVGQKVSSYGVLVNGIWTAGRITVGAKLNCLP